MDLIEKLFNKVKEEIEDRTIKTIDGEFSIYRHKAILIINGKPYDISKSISEEVWNIGGEYKSPEDKWKISCEVNKQARIFLCDFDPSLDINKFLGFCG